MRPEGETHRTAPTVEVVLPTRLSGSSASLAWLERAIESLFEQTWTDWHLMVVDDASPAGTSRIERWTDAYPDRCSLIRLPARCGASRARTVGVRHSRAELLAFLDQDDVYAPRKLERQVAFLEAHPHVGAVHSDIHHVDEDGALREGAADKENAYRSTIDYESTDRKRVASSLFARNSIRIISAMFRRAAFDAVGGYDQTLDGGEDWELWVRFADRHAIGHIAEPLLHRRVHADNTSRVQLRSRLSGQLRAVETMATRHPYLAALVPERREAILRRLEQERAAAPHAHPRNRPCRTVDREHRGKT